MQHQRRPRASHHRTHTQQTTPSRAWYTVLPSAEDRWHWTFDASGQCVQLDRLDAYANVSIHRTRHCGRWQWPTTTPGDERLGSELEHAILRDDVVAVQAMVAEVGVELLNLQDANGLTPLAVAGLCSRAAVVEALLMLGADPGLTSCWGDTALAAVEVLKDL